MVDWSRPKEMMPLLEAYHSETDRGAVIVAGSLLDKLLEEILRRSMLPAPASFFEGYRPLASFSAKIDLARYLGLISHGEHAELHRIRKIRNDFAHSLDPKLTLDSQPVCDHIRQLKLPLSGLFEIDSNATLRKQFATAVGAMVGILSGILRRVETPSDPLDLIVEINQPNDKPRV